jgi:hypothetical protein
VVLNLGEGFGENDTIKRLRQYRQNYGDTRYKLQCKFLDHIRS